MEFEQRFKASGTGYCTVEDGIIYEFNPLLNGNKNRVGVTDAVYNELKAISDEYYKKRPCKELVGDAAEILEKYLTERMK